MRLGMVLLLFLSSGSLFALGDDQINSFICFGLDLTQRPIEVEYSTGEVAKLEYDKDSVTVKTYYRRDSKDYSLRKISYASPYLIESDDYNLGNVETTTMIILDNEKHLKQIKQYSSMVYSSGDFQFTGSGYSVEYSTDMKEKHFTKSGSIEIREPEKIRLSSEDSRTDLEITQINSRTQMTRTIHSDKTITITYRYESGMGS